MRILLFLVRKKYGPCEIFFKFLIGIKWKNCIKKKGVKIKEQKFSNPKSSPCNYQPDTGEYSVYVKRRDMKWVLNAQTQCVAYQKHL